MNLEGIRALLVEDNPGDARLFLELVRETGAGYLKLEHVNGGLSIAADEAARREGDPNRDGNSGGQGPGIRRRSYDGEVVGEPARDVA
jgi:hypothetical protein